MLPFYFTSHFGEEIIPCHYITLNKEALDALQTLSKSNDLLGIDIETAAKEKYKNIPNAALSPHLSIIRLLQIYDGHTCYVFDLAKIDRLTLWKEFKDLLTSKRCIAHNALFELKFFKSCGIDDINIGCSLILTKLLYHAIYPFDTYSASLDAIVKSLFKIDLSKKVQASNWGTELTFEQVQYAALDAVATLRVGERLAPSLVSKNLQNIYKLCKDAQHPIAEMELNGIGFNKQRHLDAIDIWRQKVIESKRDLEKLTGLTNITSHTIAKYLEDNLDSVTLSIWPKTEKGKLKTDAHAFAEFSYLPIVKPFSEYQKQTMLCSTFGHSLIKEINLSTGRLHASYHITGTRTGRLSSSKPNLQQLPRSPTKEEKASGQPDIREHFIPTEGNIFLCADYNQIELRIAAELSQDEVMLSAYKDGIDLHLLTASKVSNISLEQINNLPKDKQKHLRQLAKAFNFGLLYGLGAAKFGHYAKKAYGVEISEEKAIEDINTFRETYSGYRAWQLKQAEDSSMSLKVYTPTGKVRRLSEDNYYGGSLNHPIQGGAAECMLFALIRLNKELKPFNAKLCNCVHDEILVECAPEKADEVKKVIEDSMIKGFQDVFPHGITRGLVDVKQGVNWGDAKA